MEPWRRGRRREGGGGGGGGESRVMLRGNSVHSVSLSFIEARRPFPTQQPHAALSSLSAGQFIHLPLTSHVIQHNCTQQHTIPNIWQRNSCLTAYHLKATCHTRDMCVNPQSKYVYITSVDRHHLHLYQSPKQHAVRVSAFPVSELD